MGQKNKTKLQIWLLSFTSSLLLAVPYMVPHTGIVSLVAFIPLFAAEQIAHDSGRKHFFHIAYLSFLIWNLITTYWVWFATPPGAVAAFVLNTLQMAVIFSLFRWMRRYTNGFLPYLFFCFLWLAWEHSYQTWQVSWPWLVLGNGFAGSVRCIQWYEYTGVLGGSFWILLSNMLLFRILLLKSRNLPVRISVMAYAAVIIIPMAFSLVLYSTYREEERPVQFSVLQPNIDPYGDKFSGLSMAQQNNILLNLGSQAFGDLSQTGRDGVETLVLAPETFIHSTTWQGRMLEEQPQINPSYQAMQRWLYGWNARGMEASLLTGAVTYDLNDDNYNSSIFIPSAKAEASGPGYYHKSKLVILAESNPFKSGPFQFMDKLVEDIAGGIGDYGTQEERTVFETPGGTRFGTAICYESIYGDFFREWAYNGAQVMTIITNDGWWRNTAGHRQHLAYARLRAIENRRSIARCANTGISAFINQRGDIVEQTGWWEKTWLNGSINANDRHTVFTLYGDIIGRMSRFLTFLFLLLGVVKMFSKRLQLK